MASLRSYPAMDQAYWDWFAEVDQAALVIWSEWMTARRKRPKNRGVQKWSVVSKVQLFRAWKSFAELGFVRRPEEVDDIASRCVVNAAKLQVNTILMGHESESPEEFLQKTVDENLTESKVERLLEGFEDFCVQRDFIDGQWYEQWRISDNMDRIAERVLTILLAVSPEEKLQAVDILLNFAHRRTDLAACFVEGGSSTLAELSATK